MKEFNESEHPRDNHGKFTDKNGNLNSKKEEFVKKYSSEPDKDLREENMVVTGAFSGALDPNSERAQEHALRMYNEISKRTTDCKKISKLLNISEEKIREVKEYIFVPTETIAYKTKFGDEFFVDYRQAESWRRLSEGNPKTMDIIFIKHEILELEYRKKGLTYKQSHLLAEDKYNYKQAIMEEENGNIKKD